MILKAADIPKKKLKKQMLLHAMVWNPAAASAIREMLEAYAAENKDEALAAAIAPFAERSEQDDLWNMRILLMRTLKRRGHWRMRMHLLRGNPF